MKTIFKYTLIGLALAIGVASLNAQNTNVTYQGRVRSGGSDFNGLGQFKFALVNSVDVNTRATATAVTSGGFVTIINVTSGGSGYVTPPPVTISGGGGLGATAAASLSTGGVTSINVASGGSSYVNAPTVTISGGGGSGAAATASISGGVVISINVTSRGNGYVSAPTVTMFGGGGSGASAAASINGGTVTSINVNNPGSAYTSTPTVSIGAPPETLPYTTYWSNDGASSAGSEPAVAVSVPVNNGLFTVRLGDGALPNMAPLTTGLFTRPNLELRIWFNDGANGFEMLSPAQRLTAAPYALVAGSASNLLGAVSTANLGGAYGNAVTFNNAANSFNGASMSFGSALSQKVNLYGTTFGIGIQSGVQYSRVAPTGGFAWFAGGVHNDNSFNSGGGTTVMRLDGNGNLFTLGAVNPTSDRNAKENFTPVQPREMLEKVVALPLSSWNFKADTATRHIGPMAQDFYAAFNVGPDDKHIATVDADGVALAAIQGLNQKLTEELQQKGTEITELKARLEKLEERMNRENGGVK